MSDNISMPVALAAVPAAIAAYYALSSNRKNWFESRGRYEPFNPDFYPPEKAWKTVQRQYELDGELEIVMGRGGVCAMEPITIPFLFDKCVSEHIHDIALGYEVHNRASGAWEMAEYTWGAYRQHAHEWGRAMIGLGLKQHDVITVLASNAPEWFFAQTGVVLAGGVCSGIYPSSLPGALKYITNHCETRIAFCDSREQVDKYLEIEDELEHLEHLVVFDDLPLSSIHTRKLRLWSIKDFIAMGKDLPSDTMAKRIAAIRPGHCALLSYTSGTTGNPKGVMLSHDNIITTGHFYMESRPKGDFIYEQYPRGSTQRSVSYLPLCHVAAMLTGWMGPLLASTEFELNSSVYFARRDWTTSLFETVKAVRPTGFFGVPRIWEKIAEGIQAQVAASSSLRQAIFNLAVGRGQALYENIQAGGSGDYPCGYDTAESMVFMKILEAIGLEQAKELGSGGAPLSEATKAFFGGMGHLMGNGYGMTESAGAGSASRANHYISDALGIPCPGFEIRIEHDPERDPKGHGEICMRGRPVMMGYLKQPEKTLSTIDENGWLHTGDQGRFDGPVLYITGRIKELIVTAGGENVAPVPIEHYVKSIRPAIGNVVIVGDQKKYLTALVAILTDVDPATGDPTNELLDQAKVVNPSVTTVEQAKIDPIWIEYIRSAFEEYNQNQDVCVSNASRIQYFSILPQMLCQSQGTVGPTLKTKRHVVHEIYKNQIESMYEGQGIPVTNKSKL